MPWALPVAIFTLAGCRWSTASLIASASFTQTLVEVLEVGAGLAAAVGKAVAVRGTVAVRGPDEDVLGGNALDPAADLVAQDARETEEVRAANGDARAVILQHQGPDRQLADLARDGLRSPDPAGDRQQLLRRHVPHGDGGPKGPEQGTPQQKR